MVDLDFNAEIITDSVAPNGVRLTSMQVTFPRFLLAEFNTHRRFSRNAASSRAIPVKKRIEWVDTTPVMPVEWGRNQPGMQASEILTPLERDEAERLWLRAKNFNVRIAARLDKLNVHKQIANRVLEPWAWITVIVTATEWSNFFGLRCNIEAQPEIQSAAYLMRGEYLGMLPDDIDIITPEMIRIAHMMEQALEDSLPEYMHAGQWHMPYLRADDYDQFGSDNVEILRKLSTARCARVSYLTQDGVREPAKDIELHDRLGRAGHWSPYEHVAQALNSNEGNKAVGNFYGWYQYRKCFPSEEIR